MPLFRALAKNMAASYFGKKAPYGFVMAVTLLYVFILCCCSWNRLHESYMKFRLGSGTRAGGDGSRRSPRASLPPGNFM